MKTLFIGNIISKKLYKLDFSIIAKDINELINIIKEEYPTRIWKKPNIIESYLLSDSNNDDNIKHYIYIGKYNSISSNDNHFIAIAKNKNDCQNLINTVDGILINNFQIEYRSLLSNIVKNKQVTYKSKVLEIYTDYKNLSKNNINNLDDDLDDDSDLTDAKLIMY
jgi:hypothetical protein